MSQLSEYQPDFIDFLLACDALKFGDFTTKSGRKTPYFINTGSFDSGERIRQLGVFYAAHLVHSGLTGCDTIFGPAYKGVPLAVATSIALQVDHSIDAGYSFDRKEAKEHGDKGFIVGRQLQEGDRVIIVEDVITAGTTLQRLVLILREKNAVQIAGVIVAVD